MSQEIRNRLKSFYPSKNWALKVDKMSDAQVLAATMRIQNKKKK